MGNKRKVLIIDDLADNIYILNEILSANNFEVIAASNGKDGIQQAISENPDIIVCDIMMPEINGFQVLEELRNNPKTMLIPFIFLSARSELQDIRNGMKLGADDYITKPVNRKELINAINTRLDKKDKYDKKLNELRLSISYALPHELKTPLVSILGFSQIIKNDVDLLKNNEVSEMAEIIYKSANNLNRIIQKMLFYVKLELLIHDKTQLQIFLSGTTEINKDLVYKINYDTTRSYNREKDLRLEITDSTISISEPNIKLILTELVDNALKFSTAGSEVKITGNKFGDRYTFHILNSGHGLTDEQIAYLGGYFQADRMLYEQPGLGLGIPIAKKITELHSGELKIESIPGKKTMVSVTVPLANY
jgi:two-component system sensor histidine kinase/response regulator